jgi:hypothetical protein
MRRSPRLIAAAVLISLSGALAGCSSLYNFDPTDALDWLDTKKKLPGERKPVFPDGVPGLEQGVPKELYKGSRQEQIDQQNAQTAAAATTAPPEDPKSKRAAKGKKQPATASTAPASEPAAGPDAAAAPEDEGGTAAAPPAPPPKKIVRKRTTAPPPDQPAAQSGQPAQSAQPTQQSAAPFPAPMPSGTFSR